MHRWGPAKRDFIGQTLMAAFNCKINEIGNSLITIIAPDNIYDARSIGEQWAPTVPNDGQRITHATHTPTSTTYSRLICLIEK